MTHLKRNKIETSSMQYEEKQKFHCWI